MVRSSSLLLAAVFVISPVLAAPTPHHHHRAHVATDAIPESSPVASLEARDPNPFSFRKAFSSVANVVKQVAPIAAKVAPMLMGRDEEGNIYVRELEEEELDFLQAREPRISPVLMEWARKHRTPPYFPEPRRKRPDLGLREIDDGVYLEVREFDPSGLNFDLEERDFDLDARDPWTFRGVWNDVKNVAGKVLGVVDKVSATAHRMGLRELEDDAVEAEARSLNELD
ncbi:hypothetical protein MD484_g3837, partial [Candolleomyces efflorescens]